jgi:hypothetical protein
MSGVFSIASHAALQYFSEVVQEQFGCAHFLSEAICILPFEGVAVDFFL